MGNLGELPAEIVLLIMQHVYRWDIRTCAHINRHFYTTTMPLRWKSLSIRNKIALKSFTAVLLESPWNMGAHIRHLNIHSLLTDTTLLLLMKHLIYLESLTLQSCQGVTDTSFQHLPRHCPHLRSLHVASCQITKRSIIALGHHCRQLESLFLADCHRIHFGVFSTLVYDDTGPPSTTTTTKTSSTHVLQESTAAATALDKYVTDGLEQHHLDDSQRLATLSAHRWYPPPSKGIPWPHLSTVQLGGLFDAGTANMIAFIETHRHLQRIHLTQTSFSNAVLDAMATSCGSRLVSLQVPGNTWLTSQGVRQLVCLCPLLRYVNVDGCDMLANEFPEANAGCQVDVTERLDRMGAAVWVGDESPPSSGTNSGGGGTLFLHHLDQDAIDNIRLANSNMDFFLPPMD